MKIVHIDTGMDLRGGQRQLLLLARGLRQRDHEQLIVCPESSALEQQARGEQLRVFSLPAHDPAHAHGILQARQQLKVERFDLVHAHDGRGHTLSFAMLKAPVRRIATRRVTFLPSRIGMYLLKHDSACHAILAVSHAIRRSLIDAGVPEGKIEVIPDGIELPGNIPVAEARCRVRRQWGFNEKEFLIGHVGAFTPEKGQDIAIQAMETVAERIPQARLLLAGEGPTRPKLARLAKSGAAQDRVRFLGYVENLGDFFAVLDIFLMPSRAEGLGSSALMAMAYGLPVIATRVGGLPEIVDETTGWLIDSESPAALAEAIIEAASQRLRLGELGSNARDRARRFSSNIMIERTEALYYRLLAR